jgi:hypothetical protein
VAGRRALRDRGGASGAALVRWELVAGDDHATALLARRVELDDPGGYLMASIHAFCVPGESYLAVLDALLRRAASIRFIVCRHEGGAAFMAEA